MYCSKCGKEIFDEAVVCPYCGCAVSNQPQRSEAIANYTPGTYATPEPENGGLATAALVFAFLVPVVGLILGIIGTIKFKTQNLKNKCIAAIPISIVIWIINSIVIFGLMNG